MGLIDLPGELIIEIAEFLYYRTDLYNLHLVCKKVHKLVLPMLWRDLNIQVFEGELHILGLEWLCRIPDIQERLKWVRNLSFTSSFTLDPMDDETRCPHDPVGAIDPGQHSREREVELSCFEWLEKNAFEFFELFGQDQLHSLEYVESLAIQSYHSTSSKNLMFEVSHSLDRQWSLKAFAYTHRQLYMPESETDEQAEIDNPALSFTQDEWDRGLAWYEPRSLEFLGLATTPTFMISFIRPFQERVCLKISHVRHTELDHEVDSGWATGLCVVPSYFEDSAADDSGTDGLPNAQCEIPSDIHGSLEAYQKTRPLIEFNREITPTQRFHNFASWLFSTDGITSVQVLALGDFADFSMRGYHTALLCRNEDAAKGAANYRKVKVSDWRIWELVLKHKKALAACPCYPLITIGDEEDDE